MAALEEFHGAIGVDAVRPATIGDVLPIFGQRAESRLQLVDRDRDCTSDVSGLVLVRGASIENDDILRANAREEVLHPHRFRSRSVAEILGDEPFEVRQPLLRDTANGDTEVEHHWIRKAVVDEQSLFSSFDESRLSQRLKMLRRVRQRESRLRRQRLHGALALREQFQQLQPMRITDRLADTTELRVEAICEVPMRRRHNQLINRSLEYARSRPGTSLCLVNDWVRAYAMEALVRHRPSRRKPSTRLIQAVGCAAIVVALASTMAASSTMTAGLGPPLTTEHGLPQSSVAAILPTADGYLWLGTFGGLVRFDGRDVKVFTAANTPGLTSNRVLSLAEDRDAIWVGTEYGGVVRLVVRGDTASIREHLLPDDTVSALARDARGRLWIGTGRGLMTFADGRLTGPTDDAHLAGERVQTLAVDHAGRIWASTTRGITIIDDTRRTRMPALDECSVPSIHARPHGGSWLATSCGLFGVGDDDRLERLLPGNFHAVTEDADGVVWGSTHDGRILGVRGQEVVHTIEPDAGTVRALAVDREGTVWFGTNQNGAGRWRMPGIQHVSLPGAERKPVLATLEDASGTMWVGAWCAGLFRVRQNVVEQVALPEGLSRRCIYALAIDSDQRLWAAGSGGVFRIDHPSTAERVRQVAPDDTPPIYAIHQTADGRLWFGGQDGLFEWREDRLVPHTLPPALSRRQVRFITSAADGSLWLGTTGGFAHARTGGWDVWTSEQGLSHPFVRAIHPEGDRVWIGTYGGGINLLANGRLTACTSRQGLPDDAVSRMLDDERGSFWVSSNRGVFRVSKTLLAACAGQRAPLSGVVPFTRLDGLPSTETNGGAQPAGWRARDGRLWIPTVAGLAVIDPGRVGIEVPRVVVQRITLDQQDVTGAAITVPAGAPRLDIGYAALTFAAAHRVRFRYRLEGYDPAWIDAGDERSARYTSLPPGTFRFRLAVSTGDGEWHETNVSLAVTQRAAITQRWWFIGLVGVLMLLAGYGTNRVRVRVLTRRTRELEEHVAARTADLQQQRNALHSTNELLAGANAQLASANENLQTVIDRLSVGALMLDPAGRVVFMNRAARSLLYREIDAYDGMPWHDLLPLGAEERRQIERSVGLPAQERTRLSFPAANVFDRHFSMEIDVQDDPRNPAQKMLFLYDVSELFDLRRLRAETAGRHGLLGESPAMRVLFKQIQDVSASDATILIEGETGSGKELVARAIHGASARRQRPFVAVNCAGLTESLLASQLFGHRKGAFTGAVADQVGLVEAAHGGTLFLDEVGDIPLAMQTTLLRALQEREIVRVGESAPRRVDIRIVAATHRNLDVEVAAGRLRQDLLYRIRVVRVRVPALRERAEDIPLLVGRFLTELRRSAGEGATTAVSREAMAALMAYAWPGNVRELRSAIESAALAGRSSIIQRDDLPLEVRSGRVVVDPHPSHQDGAVGADAIREALRRTRGNRAAAARALGIGRTTLYRRLKELGLDDAPGVS
jgi:sigma-54 dependent transcriptional regulator, acetoin dehydrogenase operon transcriptional activator AcoR